jgi:transposase
VPDALWAEIAPLLPRHRRHRKGGRPWLDDRLVFVGIVYILRTGIAWDNLPTKAFGCSGMTCWRRMREWQRDSVWKRLHQVLLDRLNDEDAIDWSRAAVDSGSVAAPRGGTATGRNPTDRGKLGTKRHLVVDAQGIPLAVALSGANEHDSRMLEEIVDAIPPIHHRNRRGRPRRRPEKLHCDKGYDYRRCRRALRRRHIIPRVARRGIESPERLGRYRWVVERTLAWLNGFRRLRIRYERRAENYLAFIHLACALICSRFIMRLC